MVDALTPDATSLPVGEVQQFLHGYSDGHRLIESSLKLPNELARLMLKLSDLSGSSVVGGFERYITGYPLDPINAYALAMTWYAPEMPRPGCVWTHTVVLSAQALASIPSLSSLTKLFKRPVRNFSKTDYAGTIRIDNGSVDASVPRQGESVLRYQLNAIFWSYYESTHPAPVVLVARDSDEFADAIFALWSQQWPSLRQKFSFSTGSLSGRSLDNRAFDIQCAPPAIAKEVARDAQTLPLLIVTGVPDADSRTNELTPAIEDALVPNGGPFRTFLWASVDDRTTRRDVPNLVKIYDFLTTSKSVDTAIHLIAEQFPENRGAWLSRLLLSSDHPDSVARRFEDRDILFALATAANLQISDPEALLIEERISRLCASNPRDAWWLLRQLFEANVNDLGEQMLTALIVHMSAETAQEITQDRPKFLPSLFRARPDLACSAELWRLGSDRKRELFDAVATKELLPSVVHGIVVALLDSDSEDFLRRSIALWGKDAVFAALDWVESHEGHMSLALRNALDNQPDSVMDWVQQTSVSAESLVAIARVVAPYASRISMRNPEVWLRTFQFVEGTVSEAERNYLASFLLALAFCNTPLALDLIAASYQRVHEAAWSERLSDEAWSLVKPFVPELHWPRNWDKCERLNRGLVEAFIRYHWPSRELRRIKNYHPRNSSTDLMQQILDSARDVKDGKEFIRDVERSA